jgi:hypothetical protein
LRRRRVADDFTVLPLAPLEPPDGDFGAGMVSMSPSQKLVRSVADRSGFRRR